MSQEERNLPNRDHPLSEDGEPSSQQATGIPTEPASLTDSPSLPSRQGPRRPLTRRLAHDIQAYQQSLGVMSSRDEILRWDDGQINLFQGLTPPPLPTAMLPTRKRTLREILSDEKRPEKDKLAQEIDKLADEAGPSSSSYVFGRGPAEPGNGGEASGVSAQKRIRLDPTPRVMPTDEPTGGRSGSGHDTDGNEDSPGDGSSSRRTRDSDGNNNGSFPVSR
ncbi:hypothetical protein F4810DRAFT_716674 [Camillea tinctor]|nr:hypothetical protein F4810DRAFT_716674 [Camillea tinctor]